MIMKLYLVIMFVISGLFLAVETASACTCTVPVGKSDKELVNSAKDDAKTVFIGRVIKIVKTRNHRGVSAGGYNAVFEVSEIWKGAQKRQIRIFFSDQCCLCVFPFRKGKEYLVYASGDSTKLTASTCGRTKEIGDPALTVDRQYLGSPITTTLNK
jgi:hypothetical protein